MKYWKHEKCDPGTHKNKYWKMDSFLVYKMREEDQKMDGEDRGGKGNAKRLEVCYVQVQTSHKEPNICVLTKKMICQKTSYK